MPRTSTAEYIELFYRAGSAVACAHPHGYRTARWSYRRIADVASQVARELEARGTSLERSEQAGSLLAFLDAALQQHPDWAYLHFLRARELERRGDAQGARSALGQAALHDRERAVMEQYNERVRLVARSLDAELLDLARSFEAKRSPHLFNDVVHPSKVGHKLIAEALSQTLLRLEGRTQPEPVPAEGG